MGTLGILKVKLFWNKAYEVTNKILSRDSKYIADEIMWSKFGNFYERSDHNLNFIRIWSEKLLFFATTFEGSSRSKFNNLEMALSTVLTFYTSLTKGLKLKVRKFWVLILTFVVVSVE